MTQEPKQTRPKVLVVDDDPALLETYSELLSQLPSQPEVLTATSGSRALTLLKGDGFRLLICDLVMPKMDGLQVLAIVRRRFPELRTVVITGVEDEQLRSRAYALGVDMFWLKPDSKQNMEMFTQCIESLLGREGEGGFRGVQSKGLIDLIQMEALSQSSTLLRITRGSLTGRIWFLSGELIDAETNGARGEAAFRQILAWKSGTFENLPAEPGRERTITKPVNALLLETAQAIDEIAAPSSEHSPQDAETADHRRNVMRLSVLTREGADFVVSVAGNGRGKAEAWGTESTQEIAGWMTTALDVCQHLAQKLKAGDFGHLEARTMDHRLVLVAHEDKQYLVGWPGNSAPEVRTREQTIKLVASWDS